MDILKKLARGLSSYLFKVFILLMAVVGALVFTFHSPGKIEKSLHDSGAYSSFVSNVLDEVKKSNQQGSTDQIPIDDPAIKAAANKAFNPQFLQSSTENFLSGTYDWLSGKTKTPDFNVDLTQAKQTFAQSVGDAAANRLVSLPVCTRTQLLALANSDIDPFRVPCRPLGINIDQQKAKVVNDLATSKDFLGTTVLNANTLPKDSDGQTVFDKAAKAPKVYKWVNASPWILGLLAVVFGVLTVWLYDSKRRGLRNLAVSLGGTGALLIIFNLLSNWSLHKSTSAGGVLTTSIKGSFQQTALKAIESLASSIWHVITWYAVVYLVIAIGVLACLHFIKPKKSSVQPRELSPQKPNSSDPKPTKA